MEVTLANALRLKNRQVRKVQDLERRMLQANVYYWDQVDDSGKATVEDRPYSEKQFRDLLGEWSLAGSLLCKIKQVIAKANQVECNGTCIDNLVKERGELGHKLEVFKQFREQRERDRYSDRERIKKTVLAVPEIDSEIDGIQSSMRDLDDKIADVNALVKVEFPE